MLLAYYYAMVVRISLASVLLLITLLSQLLRFQSYLLPPYKSKYIISRESKCKLYMAGVPVVPYYPNKGSKDYMWMDIYNALGKF